MKFSRFFNNYIDDEMILEGGAAGHLRHPFEERDLSFSEIKEMINVALQGFVDKESKALEKVDGQNIAVSWKNGRLIAARNKGHVKNFGAGAMTINDLKNLFKGRGQIADAFGFAMDDLNKAIKKLSDEQKYEIFGEGKRFMNVEIIYMPTENVIPYGKNILIFLGTFEYDESGEKVGEMDQKIAHKLQNMVKDVNQHFQKTFELQSLEFLKLPKHKDFDKMKKWFHAEVDKIKRSMKLSDNHTIGEYHDAWWMRFIKAQAKKYKYKITTEVLEVLRNRWARFDKSTGINYLKKVLHDEPKFLEWVRKFDKENHAVQFKENMLPFEVLFLKLGVEVMTNLEMFLSANPTESSEKIRKRIEKDIKDLKKTKDIKKLHRLDVALKRLNAIGGLDKIISTEGITFWFKGKLYKLTGTFAPVNQILGLLTF